MFDFTFFILMMQMRLAFMANISRICTMFCEAMPMASNVFGSFSGGYQLLATIASAWQGIVNFFWATALGDAVRYGWGETIASAWQGATGFFWATASSDAARYCRGRIGSLLEQGAGTIWARLPQSFEWEGRVGKIELRLGANFAQQSQPKTAWQAFWAVAKVWLCFAGLTTLLVAALWAAYTQGKRAAARSQIAKEPAPELTPAPAIEVAMETAMWTAMETAPMTLTKSAVTPMTPPMTPLMVPTVADAELEVPPMAESKDELEVPPMAATVAVMETPPVRTPITLTESVAATEDACITRIEDSLTAIIAEMRAVLEVPPMAATEDELEVPPIAAANAAVEVPLMAKSDDELENPLMAATEDELEVTMKTAIDDDLETSSVAALTAEMTAAWEPALGLELDATPAPTPKSKFDDDDDWAMVTKEEYPFVLGNITGRNHQGKRAKLRAVRKAASTTFKAKQLIRAAKP